MKTWAYVVTSLEAHGTCAMVSIVAVEGSAPREIGARMIVTPQGYHGSIGGGTLEWHAIAQAQALLGQPTQQRQSSHSLGPDLGQCCGGRVTLVTEVFDRSFLLEAQAMTEREKNEPFTLTGRIGGRAFEEHFGHAFRPVYLFGAGHVGRALVLALAPLNFALTWIDSRDAAFPGVYPANVKALWSCEPVREMASAPPESFALIMTHSHALDLEITDAALRNPNFAYVGLIGSSTKRARFEKRLREGGVAEARIHELVCPIGIASIRSKHPASIAVATAAQLIERDEVLRRAEVFLAHNSKSVKVGAGRRA